MRTLLWTLGLSFLASYLGKVFADAFLHAPVRLLGSWLWLDYTQNPGIAFGLRLPAAVQPFLIIGAVAVLLWVALKSRHTAVSAVGFGLLLGGALGNIVDRTFDGLVTDYFRAGWFPVFNVADSCITVGVAILVAEGALAELARRRAAAQPRVQ